MLYRNYCDTTKNTANRNKSDAFLCEEIFLTLSLYFFVFQQKIATSATSEIIFFTQSL